MTDPTGFGEYGVVGRNQFDLLTGAIEGLLTLLVEDWRADVPTVRDPWEGAGPLGKTSGTGEVWAAINQARGVLGASARWDAPDFLADNERLRAALLDVLNAFDVYVEDDEMEPLSAAIGHARDDYRTSVNGWPAHEEWCDIYRNVGGCSCSKEAPLSGAQEATDG